MQDIEVDNLTINEIKQMLLASIKDDIYVAKCFVDLVLKERDNSNEDIEMLKEVRELLSKIKTKEATQLIINKL